MQAALVSQVETKVLMAVVGLKNAIEQYKGHINPSIVTEVLCRVQIGTGELSMEINKTYLKLIMLVINRYPTIITKDNINPV